ncbi:hypothetical protein ACVNS2_24050 [Paenibacillus caseinilyticus]|uniref:Uncharacterized protein n=1 Tax=Paenibacillus mucilaginosus K02 TaxID=997761 RepID=I0BMZ6_9BACL|nr:hypothetical protein [Paenibacillus mucilaginosus]AFH63743.1 hypothetical protein B2K_24170 [Paenibacillus mucilaginosus K02]
MNRMNDKVEHLLQTALENWSAMAGAGGGGEEAEANEFESSFYRLIDAVREWYEGLKNPPRTLEAFMALPEVESLTDRLPGPLHLNFETEAELILEKVSRIDEDKYD